MRTLTYDVVVVGATRAGFAAVESAHELGFSVALVDYASESRHDEILWPELLLQTGALRNASIDRKGSARAGHEAACQIWRDAVSRRRPGFGGIALEPSQLPPDLAVLRGPARFLTASRMELHCGIVVEAGAFVIATGSRPRRPARFNLHEPSVCDADEFLCDMEPPRSVAIVGADWLGCEWAFVCASVGAEVTLIDRRSRLLRALDVELRQAVQSRLLEMGVDIVLNEEILDVEIGRHQECHIHLSSGREQVVEKLLLLAGNRGNSRGLMLAEIGVQLDEFDHIVVDDSFQTGVAGIFAIGPISDPTRLGPSVSSQAHIALCKAMGEDSACLPEVVPWILNSSVEVAMCGLTQEACAVLDMQTVVCTAISGDPTHDFSRLAKVVVSADDGRLLGVQNAGSGAAEAIILASSLVNRDCHIEECARIVGADDTMTDIFCQAMRSALAAWRRGRQSA